MRKIILFFIFLFITSYAHAQTGMTAPIFGQDQCLWFETENGVVFNNYCAKMIVSDGSLVDNEDGSFTLNTSGGSVGATQLTELTDVNSATATAGRILVANGTTWDSVAMSGDCTIAADGEIDCSGLGDTVWTRDDVTGAIYPITLTDKVGIGITAPVNLLHVRKDHNSDTEIILSNVTDDDISRAAIRITSGTANALVSYLGSVNEEYLPVPEWAHSTVLNSSGGKGIKVATQGVTRMTVATGGNVGIGTSAPTHPLDVIGDIQSSTDVLVAGVSVCLEDGTNCPAAGSLSLTSLTDVNSSTATAGRLLIANGTSWDSVAMSGDCTIDKDGVIDCVGDIDGSGTTNFLAKWQDTDTLTNSIVFDTGTNVGIGTTNPTGTLNVIGSGTRGINLAYSSTSQDARALNVEATMGNNASLVTSYGGYIDFVTGTTSGTGTSYGLNTRIAGTASHVTVGGAFVNETTNSNSAIALLGSVTSTGTTVTGIRGTASGGDGLTTGVRAEATAGVSGTAVGLRAIASNGVINYAALFTGGNVGIGTTTPIKTLDVRGTGHFSGNVGVGTTAPATALDVVGIVTVSSDVVVGGESVCLEDGTNCPAFSTVSALTDLTDVNSSTATAGRLLIANGTSWDSVAMSGDCTIAADGEISCSAGASQLTDLSDVNSATQGAGRILVSDGSNFESVVVSGDATLAGDGAVTLADTAVTPGSYTTADITVDSKGRITAASSGTLSGMLALTDLTDVNSSTATAGRLLIANGTDWDSVEMSGDCTIAADGEITCTGGGDVSGSGTVGYLTKWTDTDEIGDSIVFEDTGKLGIGTTAPAETVHVIGKQIIDYEASGGVDYIFNSKILDDVTGGNNIINTLIENEWTGAVSFGSKGMTGVKVDQDVAGEFNAAGSTVRGLYNTVFWQPTLGGFGGGGTIYLIDQLITDESEATTVGASGIRTDIQSDNFGSGVYGIQNILRSDGTTYGISNAITVKNTRTGYGSYNSLSNAATETAGSMYGVYSSVTGDSNDNFGIYINSTTGTNNWGVYALADKNYFSGNIGIGTTSPATALDVLGTITVSTDVLVDGESVCLEDGTNCPAFSTVSALTDLTDVNSSTATAGRLLIANGTTWDSVEMSGDCTIAADGEISCAGGGDIGGSGTANFVSKFTDTDTIGNSQLFDNGTNVGIGTTIPLEFLHVAGSKLLVGLGTTVPHSSSVIFSQASGGFSNLATEILGQFGAGPSLLFKVGSIDSLMINASGSIGVGTTTPARKLDVRGDAAIVGNVGIGITNPVRLLDVRGTASFSGNVGIGTTAPGDVLSVAGNIATVGAANRYLKASGYISNQVGQIGDFGASDVGFFASSGGHLDIISGGPTLAMRVSNGGNIGIGITNPVSLLDVRGTASFSGNVGIGITNAVRPLDVRGAVAMSGNVGIGITNPVSLLDVRGTASFSGNVGVGITAPIHHLQIDNASSVVLKLGTDAGNNATILTGGTGSTNNYRKLQIIGNDIALRTATSDEGTGSADRLTIKHTSGNVGIGITAPVRLLDVRGAVAMSGNVGIGITNPVRLLDVRGTASISGNVGIGLTAANTSLLINGNAAIGYSTAVNGPSNGLAVNGNVGIGTTAPSNALTVVVANIHAIRAITNMTNTDQGIVIQNLNTTTSALNSFASQFADTGGTNRVGGSIMFAKNGTWTSTASTRGVDIIFRATRAGTDTEAMRVKADGNVGIGLTNPVSTLQISGSVGSTVTAFDTNATATEAHNQILMNCSSACTLTIPNASTAFQRMYFIKRTGAANVTISPAAGNIEGGASITLSNSGGGVHIGNDLTNWHVYSSIYYP